MTAVADLLTPADRRRLLDHLAADDERELDRLGGLARLMREPGSLAAVPEPVPLHRAGRETNVSSANSTNVSSAKSAINTVTDPITTSFINSAEQGNIQ